MHEFTGFLITDSPLALQEAIKKLAESPGLRSRMGSAARTYVLERFTEDAFARKIQEM